MSGRLGRQVGVRQMVAGRICRKELIGQTKQAGAAGGHTCRPEAGGLDKQAGQEYWANKQTKSDIADKLAVGAEKAGMS